MKKKETSTTTGTTSKSYKELNGKTRVGSAIASIWGGIKGVFTGKGPVTTTKDGTGVQVKDDKGNVLIEKPVNNTNWQNILAGVGLLVGGITGATSNTIENPTDAELQIQNEQNVRSGSNTLLIVGGSILVLIVSIWAYLKFKK